jgi:hypothetical protein
VTRRDFEPFNYPSVFHTSYEQVRLETRGRTDEMRRERIDDETSIYHARMQDASRGIYQRDRIF